MEMKRLVLIGTVVVAIALALLYAWTVYYYSISPLVYTLDLYDTSLAELVRWDSGQFQEGFSACLPKIFNPLTATRLGGAGSLAVIAQAASCLMVLIVIALRKRKPLRASSAFILTFLPLAVSGLWLPFGMIRVMDDIANSGPFPETVFGCGTAEMTSPVYLAILFSCVIGLVAVLPRFRHTRAES